ncbi:MAG: hypothetical protein MJZ37_08520 [Bacilli bacterium]|nr:hypothetical protein [Bacilli bacterium]
MKLKYLLEITNLSLYLMIEDVHVIVTEEYTTIDDYFTYDVYRQYDNREVDFVDADETDISNLPTLFITLKERKY